MNTIGPFNPSVANAFFRAGEIEAWGRGIQRIYDACREARAPAPRIEYEPHDLSIEFRFPADYIKILAGKDVAGTGKKPRGTTQETTQETAPGKILSLLQADPSLTRDALARRIGLTADGIKYHLDKLKAAGRIRHVGPTKAGRWEVLK